MGEGNGAIPPGPSAGGGPPTGAGPPDGKPAMPGLLYMVGDGVPTEMGVPDGAGDGAEPGIAYAVGVETLGGSVGGVP